MSTVLTDIIEKVDRSLFEAIRLELVDKGYLPDVADTGTYPDNDAGVAAWKAAITAIVGVKGFSIEIYGIGSSQKKYEMKVPRIVITNSFRLPGDLGTAPDVQYALNQGSTAWEGFLLPPQTANFEYEITLVYNTAAENRVMHQILALALPKRGYIQIYNSVNPEDKFFIKQLGYNDYAATDEGYKESTYTYRVDDIIDSSQNKVKDAAKIVEIKVEDKLGDPDDYTDGPTFIVS
jgi:hypothetical protein